MSNKDTLFSLIKTLTQGEKAFYTKAYPKAKNGKLADHIILFNAIDKMVDYDEVKLKLKLKNHTFLNHLAVVKNQLFHLLLKQLKLYYKHASIKNELFELLQDVEILIKKGLYRESYKVLLKAEKIADKYEYFTFSLDIYDRLLRLNYDLVLEIDTIAHSLEIYEKQKVIHQKIAEIDELRFLRSISNAIRSSNDTEERKLEQQVELLQKPILSDDYQFKSYNAGYYYYNLRGRILVDNRKLDPSINSHAEYAKLVKHLENNSDLLEVNLINYSMALNNLIYANYELDSIDFNYVLGIIDKLENIKSDNQYLVARIKEKVTVNRLVYFLLTKKYNEGVAYISSVEKEFIRDRELYNSSFYTEAFDAAAMIYFLVGDYSKSLKQVNYILNDKGIDRIDIQCFHKILNLLIHCELKNFEHLEYLLKPTEAFLVKHNYFSSFRKEIILFFKSCHGEINEFTLKERFQELSNKLALLEHVETNKFLFKIFNLKDWADSKIDVLIH
jgi:hypothetical protein